MPTQIVIVSGVPGAGKSSIVKGSNLKGYKVVNVGDVVFQISAAKGLVENRDQTLALPKAIWFKIQKEAFTKISKMSGKIVLDTHLTVEQHGRFNPGFPEQVLRLLGGKIVGIVYIYADTEAIRRRRERDKSRKRYKETKLRLDTQKSVDISLLSYYSAHLNIPLYLIDNEEGKLNKAREVFKTHLKDAFGEKN